jgi:hypothetical protein
MFRNLVKIANKLDSLGLTKEADILDNYIRKMALDIPDADLDSLPDSPEEVARMKADQGQNMMGTVTYGPGGSTTRGVTTPKKVGPYVATAPAPGTGIPSKPLSAKESDRLLREKAYKATGSGQGIKTPQQLQAKYNFDFMATPGRGGPVEKIQQALNTAGFKAGTPDGKWGANTEAAFFDAVHSFVVSEIPGKEDERQISLQKLIEIGGEILNGERPTMPFTLPMVIEMCNLIKKARDGGYWISEGIAMKDFIGSKGGGRYEQGAKPPGEATLVSTKAGEPRAGTPRK